MGGGSERKKRVEKGRVAIGGMSYVGVEKLFCWPFLCALSFSLPPSPPPPLAGSAKTFSDKNKLHPNIYLQKNLRKPEVVII